MNKNTWSTDFAKELKSRDNPTDLKEGLIGVVIGLDPLTVHIENGQITLTAGDQLIISEWFQKRWNINKTSSLSADVPSLLSQAKAVIEHHSSGGAPCIMPNAITDLANAITKIQTELLQLKLDLKVKDEVVLLPADIVDKYFVIDKV